MPQQYRLFLEEECGISGLRELCRVSFQHASPPLEDHIHPDAAEICFLRRGRQVYMVKDEAHYEAYYMESMDVFVTYPNEVHGSGKQPEEKSDLYYLIIDTVNRPERFLGFPDSEAEWVARQINSLPNRLFRGSERIRYLWDELKRHYQAPHPVRIAMLRSAALFLFMEILHCSMYGASQTTEDIQASLEYIEENIGQWLPLSLLADRSGLSLSRFKMKFRSQVGMPPGEYILREKIRRAEEMLVAGHSVTYTAHELDFSSSQHLSTVFKAFTGRQPRDGKR